MEDLKEKIEKFYAILSKTCSAEYSQLCSIEIVHSLCTNSHSMTPDSPPPPLSLSTSTLKKKVSKSQKSQYEPKFSLLHFQGMSTSGITPDLRENNLIALLFTNCYDSIVT